MARKLKEIKNFNVGLVSNADSREVPADAAIFNKNVDPNAPGGVLRANKHDVFKGNAAADGTLTYAKLRTDSGVTITEDVGNTQTQITTSGNVNNYLRIGEYIAIGKSCYQLENILADDSTIIVSAALFGSLQSGAAAANGAIIYKLLVPKSAFSYIDTKDTDVEHVITYDQCGRIDAIANITNDSTSDTVGDGINAHPDFKFFPHYLSSSIEDISVVSRFSQYYIGTSPSFKSKWLGKVISGSIFGVDGMILDDAELYAPNKASVSDATYTKIVTFYGTTSDSGTYADLPLIQNNSKVVHVGFKRGENFIYIIDGDSGLTHKSQPLPFAVQGLAKVVSCKTDIRVWLLEGGNMSNYHEAQKSFELGKVHSYEVFDLGGSDDIYIKDGTSFPLGIGLSKCQTLDCKIADSRTNGYPSAPVFRGTPNINDWNGLPKWEGLPWVGDILETVDSSGNGKVWMLLVPTKTRDEDALDRQEYTWFRTVRGQDASNNAFELHRFLFCTHGNIDGDTSDGTTTVTYFNDKSMPISTLYDCGMTGYYNYTQRQDSFSSYTPDNASYGLHQYAIGTLRMVNGGNQGSSNGNLTSSIAFRLSDRSVPTTAGTSYVDIWDDSSAWGPNRSSLYNIQSSDGKPFADTDKRSFMLVHGGSYWYVPTPDYAGNIQLNRLSEMNETSTNADERPHPRFQWDVEDVNLNNGYQDWIMADTQSDQHNLTQTAARGTEEVGFDDMPNNNEELVQNIYFPDTDYLLFKPLANSLVDMSDMYDGVDHVVTCFIAVTNQYNPMFIEDMWVNTEKVSSGNYRRRQTRGVRGVGCGGKMLLWTTNAGINNYGASYCRSNSFGFQPGAPTVYDATEEGRANDIPLSTLCIDKSTSSDKAVIRVLKVVDSFYTHEILSVARNNPFSSYQGFGTIASETIANDNSPHGTMMFITIPKPAAEDSGEGESGAVDLPGDGSEYGMRIYSLSYNSTAEQADALSGPVTFSTGSHGVVASTPEKVAGYSKNTGTVGSGSIVDNYSGGTSAIDDEQKHPVNEESLLKATEEYAMTPEKNYNGNLVPMAPIANESFFNTLTVAAADSNWTALNSDAGQAPDTEVSTRLLHKYLVFDKDNAFLQKIIFCSSLSNVLQSPYTKNIGTIANNSPLFMSAETFGRVYPSTIGPHRYQNKDTHFLRSQISQIDIHPQSFSHLSGSNSLVPEDFLNPTILNVWHTGTPQLTETVSLDGVGNIGDGTDITKSSTLGGFPYRLSLASNGSGSKIFYCTLRDLDVFDTANLWEENFSDATVFPGGLDLATIDWSGNNVTAIGQAFDRRTIHPFDEVQFPNFIESPSHLVLYVYGMHKKSLFAELGVEFFPDEVETGSVNYPNAVKRHYKVSFEYDGVQESPLCSDVYSYAPENSFNEDGTAFTDDCKSITVKITISQNISKRVSALILYRRGGEEEDTTGMSYVKVKRVPLNSSYLWKKVSSTGGTYKWVTQLKDELNDMGTYSSLNNNISESLISTNLNYELSATDGKHLFVSNVHSALIANKESTIVRSLPGKFSVFDSLDLTNRVSISGRVTAMAYFNRSIYAFTLNSVYRINPDQMIVEDVLEGFGCGNKDGVVVTEYGMFFADKNHVYQHDGTSAKIISYPIETDDYSTIGAGWQSLITDDNFKTYFFPKENIVSFVFNTSPDTFANSLAFTYHILKQRWDFRGFQVEKSSTVYGQHIRNDVMIISKISGKVYYFSGPHTNTGISNPYVKVCEMGGGTHEGYFAWHSKDFTMGMDSNDKRFLKIKIQASAALSTTPFVYVDGLLATLESAGTNEWKIRKNAGTGAVQKGKKVSIKLASASDDLDGLTNENIEIYSIAILYRDLKVK